MTIDKSSTTGGSGAQLSSVNGARGNEEDANKAETNLPRKRLSLRKSLPLQTETSTTAQKQSQQQRQDTNEDSPEMVYDQLMVLLQQAITEVPASLMTADKRKRR